MGTRLFRSSLAPYLESFLETRTAAGLSAPVDGKLLSYLDRFLMTELQPGQPISRTLIARYVESIAHLSIGTRINRISILRQFCLYLHYFDPRTCLVHRQFLPHRTRPAPYIYSENEFDYWAEWFGKDGTS